jgi:hypothetical protein
MTDKQKFDLLDWMGHILEGYPLTLFARERPERHRAHKPLRRVPLKPYYVDRPNESTPPGGRLLPTFPPESRISLLPTVVAVTGATCWLDAAPVLLES